MNRFLLSPAAQGDLELIWDYTNEGWGPTQAESYIREIQGAIQRVALNPLIGRACDEVRPGYRKVAVGSHVLFYRITDDIIIVIRILHGRMDFDRNL